MCRRCVRVAPSPPELSTAFTLSSSALHFCPSFLAHNQRGSGLLIAGMATGGCAVGQEESGVRVLGKDRGKLVVVRCPRHLFVDTWTLHLSCSSSVLGAMESSWPEPSIVLKAALLDRCLLCACPAGELLPRTCSLRPTMMVISSPSRVMAI
ncbi:hypothetical protein F4823DRAFT_617190 [Ustulina deusta]|nr:hypothetical protein F4823DRAFT_617190 [Ustulina deusta]